MVKENEGLGEDRRLGEGRNLEKRSRKLETRQEAREDIRIVIIQRKTRD